MFGNKLLARDLEVAAHFSKECKLDAITKEVSIVVHVLTLSYIHTCITHTYIHTYIQGDVVNRKGGFEGGFRDERASKITAMLKVSYYFFTHTYIHTYIHLKDIITIYFYGFR